MNSVAHDGVHWIFASAVMAKKPSATVGNRAWREIILKLGAITVGFLGELKDESTGLGRYAGFIPMSAALV